MLRVYGLEPVPAYATTVHVIVYTLDDGRELRDFYISLSNPVACTTSCSDHPGFAAVADLTAGPSSKRVGVRILGFVPLWAFATVTNNETQHVTVVSPQ